MLSDIAGIGSRAARMAAMKMASRRRIILMTSVLRAGPALRAEFRRGQLSSYTIGIPRDGPQRNPAT
jgi:hypothetical protein